MAFKKGGVWVIRVPQQFGRWVRRSTGTSDRRIAVQMERMCADLNTRREWQLLAHGLESLGGLFDAYRAGPRGLEALGARLDDVDLEPLVPAWLAGSTANAETTERYRVHLRTLIPEGEPFPRTNFTFETCDAWLARLKAEGVSGPTRRKYRAAAMSFGGYLVKARVLPANPVRDVEAPKAAPPRRRHLNLHDVLRLVERQEEPFRTLSALIHGTGMEISTALAAKKSDIDKLRRTIHAHGTKTEARDRIAYVAEWAWPYLERHARALMPSALLFPGISRFLAGDRHREACAALGDDFADYRMHDARHSYAVRAIKAGATFQTVAWQLGHGTDTTMVAKVYGGYQPKEDEMRRWESVAAAQDAARAVQA